MADNLQNASVNPTLCTVISGSFRKHLKHIVFLKKELETCGVFVFSPSGNTAVNPQEEFVVLDSDPITNPKILQDSVFAKIRRSTFLVVANVGGYIGAAAILEMGYAIAYGIDIYTIEEVKDPNLQPYCSPLNTAFPDVYYSYMESIQSLTSIKT